MIDYTQLKADIESGAVNDRNIVCEIGKGGFMVSVLKWLSDVALGLGATAGAALTSIVTNTTTMVSSLATITAVLQTRILAPAQGTVSTSVVTGSGSVAAGARHVEIIASTDFTGTINGATINPTHFREFSFPSAQWNTLPAIPYTITAGSLYITRIAA